MNKAILLRWLGFTTIVVSLAFGMYIANGSELKGQQSPGGPGGPGGPAGCPSGSWTHDLCISYCKGPYYECKTTAVSGCWTCETTGYQPPKTCTYTTEQECLDSNSCTGYYYCMSIGDECWNCGLDYDRCPERFDNKTCAEAKCDEIVIPGVPAMEWECEAKFPGTDNPCWGCVIPRNCGNGTLDNGEECDLGDNNGEQFAGADGKSCRTNCTWPQCSDGIDNDGHNDGIDCKDPACTNCLDCALAGEFNCEPWKESEYDVCGDPDGDPFFLETNPSQPFVAISTPVDANVSLLSNVLAQIGGGAANKYQKCLNAGFIPDGTQPNKCKCYCPNPPKKIEIAADGSKVCNLACPAVDPTDTPREHRSATVVYCHARCEQAWGDEDEYWTEACMADCVCGCSPMQDPTPDIGVVECYTECVVASEDRNVNGAYPCTSDNTNDCCRNYCVRHNCPLPDRDPTPTTPNAPPCFPAPLCPAGNACVTWRVNLQCQCEQVRILDDSFCALNGGGDGGDNGNDGGLIGGDGGDNGNDGGNIGADGGDNGNDGGNIGADGGDNGDSGTIGESGGDSSDISDGSIASQASSSRSSLGQVDPFCGDGHIDPEEECDPAANYPDVCGDKMAFGDEECDDGNTFNGDGCSSTCVFESEGYRRASRCGDNIVVPEEQCDDGNINDGDGCSSLCKDTDPSDDSVWNQGCQEVQACTGQCLCDDLYKSSSSTPSYFCCSEGQCRDDITCPNPYESEDFCAVVCKAVVVASASFQSVSLQSLGESSFFSQASLKPGAHHCGNGVVDKGEQCDPGVPAETNCTMQCRKIDPNLVICGNQVKENGEECDLGERNSDSKPNACRLNCMNPHCGDFITDPLFAEECDQGSGNSNTLADRCRISCTLPFCGDYVTDSGEECDDGNNRGGDGCSAICVIESGENDDDGEGDDDDGTPVNQDDDDDGNGDNDDGIPQNQDDDDDGNGDNDDGIAGNRDIKGCRTTADCSIGICINGNCKPCINDSECIAGSCRNGVCTGPSLIAAASICGNGTLENAEECDDRNRRDEDGCTSTCLLEIGICGDGTIQSLLGEQCEPSLHDTSLPYLCTSGCRFLSLSCGDGKVDPGEECDEGPQNSTSPDARCRPDCGSPRCGDGILDPQELCDDGNRLSGDTCDRYCLTPQEDTTVLAEVAASQEIAFNPRTSPPSQVPGMGFPQYPNYQQLPYQLPLAQLRPLIATQGPVGDTGPAAVAVIGAGTAAGLSWMRRRRK